MVDHGKIVRWRAWMAIAWIVALAPGALADDDDVDISLGGSKLFRLESADGANQLALGGRLMFDGALYDQDRTRLGNGLIERRLRFNVTAQASQQWYMRLGVEMARGRLGMRGTYLSYRGIPGVAVTFGSFREPFSMGRLTNSGATLLMERAAVAQEMAPGNGLGLTVRIVQPRWFGRVGLFADGEPDEEETDEGYAVTGRAGASVVENDDILVHVGFSGSRRIVAAGEAVSYDSRPESRVTDVRFVDTGDIEDVDSISLYGVEGAVLAGPFTLQSEYIEAHLDRMSALPDLDFGGWYVTAAVLLTGEHRTMRSGRGTFGRIRPKSPFTPEGGGVGAVELAARYSRFDLSSHDVRGGDQGLLMLGLSWYATRNYKVMFNYGRMIEYGGTADTARNGEKPGFLQMRGQVQF